MRVAVYRGYVRAFSFRNYVENVSRELERLGVELIYITKNSPIPKDVDLCWYPFSSPPRSLLRAKKPLVVSLLGDYCLRIPAQVVYGRGPLVSYIHRYLLWLRLALKWAIFDKYVKAIITVSQYAKRTLVEKLGFDENKVFIIYHGVDSNVFNPNGSRLKLKRPYFLHVSQYVPPYHNMKNLKRILEAYVQLPLKPKPYLVLVIPSYPEDINIDGVILIKKALPSKELAKLYRGALALVFPSLHETFGMPILEAMACGCPVITSNVTACPEIAGDAALLVNPYSASSIAKAMELVAEDDSLRKKLIAKGLKRVKEFTWERSAIRHKAVFEWVLNESK